MSNYLLSMLEGNSWQLQCLYNTPVLVFFNQAVIQELRQLMGYIERMLVRTTSLTPRRKVMYGFYIPSTSFSLMNCEEVYRHLLDGAMMLDAAYQIVPSRDHTFKGVSLSEKENAPLLETLGQELLVFTEWCQNRSSWRRRGYLVVVNEITRIIHKEFSHAQIEVGVSSACECSCTGPRARV